MASPLATIRRHQRLMLAFLAILAIFLFTIGDIIQTFQRTGPTGDKSDGSEVVLTWRHGSVNETELQRQRVTHLVAVQFLEAIVNRCLEKKGTPRAPGLGRDQFGRITDPGIPRSASEASLVRTMLLAEKAKSMGITINDQAITEFLERLGDDMSPAELKVILRDVVRNQMTEEQMYEQLRTELSAQSAQMIGQSGLFVTTPLAAWSVYTRLHRRVSLELAPLYVADYKNKAPEPTDAQVNEFFEKHKNRYLEPSSPEPGFKQRPRAKFQYVRADFQKDFLDPELKNVSDQEIRDHYEANKEKYRKLELPAETKPDGIIEPKPEDKQEKKEPPAPEAQPKDPSPKPEEKKDDGKKDEAPKPEDKKEDVKKDAPPKPEEKKDDSKKDDAPKPEEKQSGQVQSRALVEFVNAGEAGDDPPKPDAAAKVTAPVPNAAPPAPEAVEPPAQSKPTEEKPADTKPADTKPADTKPADTKPADTKPADTKPAAEKPPEYKSLEEVSDQIRRELASPRAQAKLEEALKQTRTVLKEFAKAHSRWDTFHKDQPNRTEPKLDLEKLPKILKFGEVPLVDALEAAAHELGKSSRSTFNMQTFQSITIPFGDIAYEDPSLFKTDQTQASDSADVHYLFWKTAWEKEYVPTLKDVREKVVDAWKMREAVVLAQAAGEKLLKQVREGSQSKDAPEGGRSLKLVLPDEVAERVFSAGPVSWLSMGAMPFGFGIPQVNPIENVEGVDDEFMASVFALKEGEVGLATNHARTVVYLVRIAVDVTNEDAQRDQFYAAGFSRELQGAQFLEQSQMMRRWFEQLEAEMAVAWKREADSVQR